MTVARHLENVCIHVLKMSTKMRPPLSFCQIYRQELTPFPIDIDNFCLRHSPPPI